MKNSASYKYHLSTIIRSPFSSIYLFAIHPSIHQSSYPPIHPCIHNAILPSSIHLPLPIHPSSVHHYSMLPAIQHLPIHCLSIHHYIIISIHQPSIHSPIYHPIIPSVTHQYPFTYPSYHSPFIHLPTQ